MRAQSTTTCSEGSCGCASCSAPTPPQERVPPKAGPSGSRVRRLRGPRAEIWAVGRKIFQLERLARQCTFYELHEVLDAQGQILTRRQRGTPFVWRMGQGCVPIDPEDAVLDDGSMVTQTTTGYTDDDGQWHRIVRYRRLPCRPLRQYTEGRNKPEELNSDLVDLLRGHDDPVPVTIRLRDPEPLPRLPSRLITGLAFTEHGRSDHVTPVRQKIQNENQRKRRQAAGPLRAWIRSVGGTVQHHATVYASVLVATMPRKGLQVLTHRPEVLAVRRRAAQGRPDETPDATYLCGGTPLRGASSHDRGTCNPIVAGIPITFDRYPFQDAINAATGILEYVNEGYSGFGIEGNANWSELATFYGGDDSPTLALGIYDDDFQPNHPGLMWAGESRFKYILFERDDSVGVADDMVGYVPGSAADASHGTRCGSVAAANAWMGSDSTLSTESERGARSGVARGVAILGARAALDLVTVIDTIGSGFRSIGGDSDSRGIDVMSISYNLNSGLRECSSYDCPTSDDARGLDEISRALVDAFLSDSILFTKSAGNTSGCSEPGKCLSAAGTVLLSEKVEVSDGGGAMLPPTSGAQMFIYPDVERLVFVNGWRAAGCYTRKRLFHVGSTSNPFIPMCNPIWSK